MDKYIDLLKVGIENNNKVAHNSAATEEQRYMAATTALSGIHALAACERAKAAQEQNRNIDILIEVLRDMNGNIEAIKL